jgi:hypothetical protein
LIQKEQQMLAEILLHLAQILTQKEQQMRVETAAITDLVRHLRPIMGTAQDNIWQLVFQ